MEANAVNYKISSNQLLLGVDYRNYTDFHSFKLALKKYNNQITNKQINNILEFLRVDLAIYCDADLEDITDDEIQLLRDLIF
ncbi:hypothetical protein GOQ27_04510 [Clostridium sp. D2Q-11]|uniref:Uncharacterized protein n=1 Tax=Anaeromonas frigoriresistens TaxID=2683708 RepID=A0A942Z5R3_9FIRM|nr:hypothetical protein [Anaeromonas frigoriresistens]MBS4537711.1 hypothetical protein [Anaeromonas frigoriresistens]